MIREEDVRRIAAKHPDLSDETIISLIEGAQQFQDLFLGAKAKKKALKNHRKEARKQTKASRRKNRK